MKQRFIALMLVAALMLPMLCAPMTACAEEGATEVQQEVKPVAEPEAKPTEKPTVKPTEKPTEAPTAKPTEAPTEAPTAKPTEKPTEAPVIKTTEKPTEAPTAKPTEAPTAKPTEAPTAKPTEAPTAKPTEAPTAKPTEAPTAIPTAEPTAVPTDAPTAEPTAVPTDAPTAEPTEAPTASPEATQPAPTGEPTVSPEPTAEPLPLAVKMATAQRYARVDKIAISVKLRIDGGMPGYNVSYQVYRNDELLDTKAMETAEPGLSTFDYMPAAHGDHIIKVTVVDASGASAGAQVTIPVADEDPRNIEKWEEKLEKALKKAHKEVEEEELEYGWREWLLIVANSQVGYRESKIDFIIDDDGEMQGVTLYGKWYRSSHAEWCAMFISWCLKNAGIEKKDFPYAANCQRWKEALTPLEAYMDDEDEYEPQPGDLIFFNWNDKNVPKHVGIVESVEDGVVHTIEGNSAKRVRRCEYELTDDVIVGYCSMEVLMKRAGLLPELDFPPVAGPTSAPE